ncbi:hypothetical protein O4J56_17800 [Nocardiopsis sp. RSe5-2]|uniref:DUF8175 domain-containing protein n=1 Tax=Nocardiopsis endophytica TaxID=3018445 RepID=A0ABT4U844_9ACTN|nr:hypothetical protein [Nocardiopsis endophytica]MDA2812502.1 hypothetical protein [Nocardiopsis endophytica]
MSQDTPPPREPERPNPFKSKGVIASLALVGAVAVAGVVATGATLLDRGGSSAEQDMQGDGQVDPDEAPSTATEVPRSDGSQSSCGLKETEKDTFEGFPVETSWEQVGLMEAPSVPGHGPAETSPGGWRHCYAKSPEGAVSAGANYAAMTSDPAVIEEVMQEMYAEGEGKERALERLEEEGKGRDDTRTLIAGARLLTYGHDRARVDLALQPQMEGAEDRYTSAVIDLRWEEGDWRVVTNENGEMVIPMTELQSLTGYWPTGAGPDF